MNSDAGANLLMFTPTSMLAATAGLIAFHMGLLTLVGRERKSPYVINSAFTVFLTCLGVAALAVLEHFPLGLNREDSQ